MAESKGKPFVGQILLLLETDPDFSQRFKQRLVFESSKVANPFKFIAGLLSKDVLSDGSNDSEGSFGLTEWMVQLATTMACSKGADKIGGLLEALEESGNSAWISALRTWAKEDFGVVTDDDDLSSEQKKVDLVGHAPVSEMWPKEVTKAIELSSSATKLIDKVLAHEGTDLMERLEAHLVGEAFRIVNPEEFCSSLAQQSVLDDSGVQSKTGLEVQAGHLVTRAIKAAFSKKAMGSLIAAFQRSGNGDILEETLDWLETTKARTKNYPIAVKSLANQQFKGTPKAVKSTFFEQPAPLDGLQKVATFNCQSESSTKGAFVLEFDREQMRARFAECTMNVWNWLDDEDKTIKFDVQVKNTTCFQFDEEILIVGTSKGTVHLFDPKTVEEKFTIRFSDPVHSLKFVESTLVILSQGGGRDTFSWVDISRQDMRLLNRRLVHHSFSRDTCDFDIDPDYSFLHSSNRIEVRSTKTGSCVFDWRHHLCWLQPPSSISTLNVLGLISAARTVIAGCKNGLIATWSKFSTPSQQPCKILKGHTEAIVGLCAVNGHLLSLDQGGKLLMWSGYDLESRDSMPLVARNLAQWRRNGVGQVGQVLPTNMPGWDSNVTVPPTISGHKCLYKLMKE